MKNLSDLNDAAKPPNPQPDFDKVLGKYHQIHQHLQEDIQVSVKKTMWTSAKLLSSIVGVSFFAVVVVWWGFSINTQKVLPQKAKPALVWKEFSLVVMMTSENEMVKKALAKQKTPNRLQSESDFKAKSKQDNETNDEKVKAEDLGQKGTKGRE